MNKSVNLLTLLLITYSLNSIVIANESTKIDHTEEIANETNNVDSTELKIETRKLDSKKPIKLSSPVLKLIDGVPGIMDEHTIHKTIYIGQELSKFVFGNIDKKTKARVPQHKFDNHLYTLKQLVKIEKEYINNKQSMESLEKTLKVVKADFQRITGPFLKDARGTKQQMIELIKESCQLRHRMDSALLTWSENSENDTFNNSVRSFKQLDIFCNDLTNFLKDLINSCPKAYKRFLDWKKQNTK